MYQAACIKGHDIIFTSDYKASHTKWNSFGYLEFYDTPAATKVS